MRNGLLGAIAALAAGAGLAFGQLQPLPGPGILDTPPGAPAGGGMDGPSPYGPDGTPNSAAQGLLGGGSSVAQGLGRSWFKAEYLLWTVKNGPSDYPLLVSGTIQNGAVAGLPGAIVLFGGKPFDYGYISAARFELGAYLPGTDRFGVEADAIIMPKTTLSAHATSGPLGIPVLGQQFLNEVTGAQDSLLAASLANPGSVSGETSTMMWTTELNVFANLVRSQSWTWNVMTGFRFFSLEESIAIDGSRSIGSAGQTFLGNAIAIGSTTATEDKFQTVNRVYGWNLGTDAEYRCGRFAFDAALQVALGDNRRTETVSGFSQLTSTTNGVVTTQQVPGGLLSAITNIGTRHDNVFSAIPEVRLDVHYQVSQCLRIGMGYSALYASNMLRPGAQIDGVVNPTITPLNTLYGLALGTARPGQVFHGTGYWAEGVNWTVTLTY